MKFYVVFLILVIVVHSQDIFTEKKGDCASANCGNERKMCANNPQW